MARFSMKSNGSIAPCRFVKQDTSYDNRVAQAGAGEKVFGVSQQGTRRTPYGALDDGYAAIAGEDISVYGAHEVCMLELGGTVTRGDRLKADSDGKGVATSTDHDEYGAVARVSGVSGQLIPVEVTPYGQISA
jgi:hypothetical protein